MINSDNKLKKELYGIPNIFHIALEVATLNKQEKTDRLNGIVWTLKRIYNFTSIDDELINTLLIIRKETMMDDGWVDYKVRSKL